MKDNIHISLLLFIFSCSMLISCNNEKKPKVLKTDFDQLDKIYTEKLKLNKKVYIVQEGEPFKIYITSNSCCPVCVPTLKTFKHIKFIENKLEMSPSENCEGCTVLSSYNFIGWKKGIDTIRLKTMPPGFHCDSITDFKEFKKFVVIVR